MAETTVGPLPARSHPQPGRDADRSVVVGADTDRRQIQFVAGGLDRGAGRLHDGIVPPQIAHGLDARGRGHRGGIDFGQPGPQGARSSLTLLTEASTSLRTASFSAVARTAKSPF